MRLPSSAAISIPMITGLLLTGAVAHAGNQAKAGVDAYVREEMTKRHIPGLALAIVRDGRLEKISAYG